jgi:hypothetical protein
MVVELSERLGSSDLSQPSKWNRRDDADCVVRTQRLMYKLTDKNISGDLSIRCFITGFSHGFAWWLILYEHAKSRWLQTYIKINSFLHARPLLPTISYEASADISRIVLRFVRL